MERIRNHGHVGGGKSLGAGFKILKAWDFDKYAVQTYRENIGDHVEQADIKELHIEDIPQATAWAFGFPCQDLSVAGKQAGIKLECTDCRSKHRHINRLCHRN